MTNNRNDFEIKKVFFLRRFAGGFWFRFGDTGYGFHGKNIKRNLITFSDRYGRRLRIGSWIFKILKPVKF